MEIKMPIKFLGTYAITTRCNGHEKKERCQKLTVSELSSQALEASFKEIEADQRPTHQITFYDFGCKRILNGRIQGNDEDRLVLRVQDKEYEFSPYRPGR